MRHNGYIDDVEHDAGWMGDAACANTDPDLWFPGVGGDTSEAKAICAGCPVQQECLNYALVTRQRFGIWGGKSEKERRRLLGHTPPRRPLSRCRVPGCRKVRRGTQGLCHAHEMQTRRGMPLTIVSVAPNTPLGAVGAADVEPTGTRRPVAPSAARSLASGARPETSQLASGPDANP